MINDFVSEFVVGKVVIIRQYWSTSKKEGYNDSAKIKIDVYKRQND